jgi:hypothetical protein
VVLQRSCHCVVSIKQVAVSDPLLTVMIAREQIQWEAASLFSLQLLLCLPALQELDPQCLYIRSPYHTITFKL